MSIVQSANGEADSAETAETAQTRPNGLTLQPSEREGEGSSSPTRPPPPTSAEIDAVIAAAMANAPPVHNAFENLDGRSTPLMTNLLPAAVGADGRVNLFVGNLPYRVRWQDLKDLFRKAGTVLRADVSLGPENRSRGYGTVLMGSREDAARAIDRYNGFSWQTRTLEVRPDRLPPEYEPQQAINQNPNGNRGPMYPYNGNHHHPHQGPPGHPGWQRPPHMNHGQGHHMPMANGISMSGPGMYMPHHQPYLNGQIRSHSPALSFTQNGMPMPMPLSGQNTGSHGYSNMGASPLAGSLTVGPGDAIIRAGSSASNTHGISPHMAHLALPRAPSPALLGAQGSRPPSSQGHHSASSHGSHANGHSFARASFSSQGIQGDIPLPHRGSIDHGQVPHLEGLGHRGPGLGPPETLHDRVIFVSNWQELKDLLRPAGLIIRADVLTNAEGRPRGFGTALFGAVEDAARAVSMFNGCEIGGQRIRVILERDSQHHDPRRPSQSNSQTDTSALGLGETNGHAPAQEVPNEVSASPAVHDRPAARLASRVPWQLNLQNQSTPIRGSAHGPDSTPRFRNFNPNIGPDTTPHFRQVRHPGPIAMPPWNPNEYSNPLSPLQTRGLPPMTPSMPGFVFNNSYPETPPIPHHFMGPFSPGIPISSPNGYGFNPFLNPAPGAPVYRPQMGGSAQLGTPTTQAFPVNTARQYPGTPAAPGAPVSNQSNGEYFPPTISESNENPATPTPPPMAPRTASQQVLNARDRLAPSAPVSEQVNELGAMTASLSLNAIVPNQGTPPTPTGRPKRSASGGNLARLVSTNGEMGAALVDSGPSSPANGRQSLDEQRPETNSNGNGSGDRRASFGDQR